MHLSTTEILIYGRSFVRAVAEKYWEKVKVSTGAKWPLPPSTFSLTKLSIEEKAQAQTIAGQLPDENIFEATSYLANLYIQRIPEPYRKELGAYFTPPHLCDRMFTHLDKRSFDFQSARVIDPASGGAAFLLPLAQRMLNPSIKDHQEQLDDLGIRLQGIELDPFNAWLSQFSLNCLLAYQAPNASAPPQVVEARDALASFCPKQGKYDLVLCNPPYAVSKEADFYKERYKEITGGKVNLYQLFMGLSVRLLKKGGLACIVSPASYLGGHYFSALRAYLYAEAPPLLFDHVTSRKKVFQSVQQEVVIALIKKGGKTRRPDCYSDVGMQSLRLTAKVGKGLIQNDAPWVTPRNKEQVPLVKIFSDAHTQLEDLGFYIHTGSVVPFRTNRMRKVKPKKNGFPLLWSDSIGEKGEIQHGTSSKRAEWYYPAQQDRNRQFSFPTLLVKRISSKEQERRIRVALVTKDNFDYEFDGFYAENHINVVTCAKGSYPRMRGLVRLMGTHLFDALFRMINGSTTVSATELRKMPLPNEENFMRFCHRTQNTRSRDKIEQEALDAYFV